MLDLERLRNLDPTILVVGRHRAIIQSMLDFDYLAGRPRPSVAAMVAGGRQTERFFFGRREIVVPVYRSAAQLPATQRERVNFVLNLSSGRRVLATMQHALEVLPNLVGASVFAEEFPERQTLELLAVARKHQVWVAGGASVGLIVPGVLKLGAIGGTEADQIQDGRLLASGSVAVMSTSGGMVNEIMRTVTASGHGVSFGLALGGERFPLITPAEAALAAEADPATRTLVYFGELGGRDEYELAELRGSGRLTKPLIAYIAGTAAELFPTPPQFGHAGAIAERADESAAAKRQVLAAAGAHVATSYDDFIKLIQSVPEEEPPMPDADQRQSTKPSSESLAGRRPALVASSISADRDGVVEVLGTDILTLASEHSLAWLVASLTLGRPITSEPLERFVDFTLRLLVDHGPQVSGAVNTIVTARAGRDLVSSLAAGLLTIGPRFGGAVNQAAGVWLDGVRHGTSPSELVETFAADKRYLPGIGHRKYRTDQPDPRVAKLLEFSADLKDPVYTQYAQRVAAITTQKKSNLILNVDGAMAAVLLDLLAETEGYTPEQLAELIEIEFFNALFVLSRSIGFTAHYLDQKRLDEGLLRLPDSDVADASA